MPLMNYKCTKCNIEVELLQKHHEVTEERKCNGCSGLMKRLHVYKTSWKPGKTFYKAGPGQY